MRARKLDIRKLFPPEQQAQVWDRVRRFWAGEDVGRDLFSVFTSKVEFRQAADREVCVSGFLEALEIESRLPGDNVPAFFPDMTPMMVPGAFGGREVVGEKGNVWLEPVVKEPEDVERLEVPEFAVRRIGEGFKRYEMITESADGEVYLRPPDLQGPLSTASLLWQQDRFLMAMYDAPEAVHRLLEIVTDFLIGLIHYTRNTYEHVVDPFWPFIVMPTSVGCSITEDLLPLLPPDLYREFGLPCTKRMAEEFGGIYIHCCGRWEQHMDAVLEIPGLKGMDVAYPESHPETVLSRLPDDVVTNWIISSRGADEYPRYSDFLRVLLDVASQEKRFFFLFSDADEGDLQECVRIVENRRS